MLAHGGPFKGFSIVLSCDKLEQWFGNFSKVFNELAIIASEANKRVRLFAGGRGCNVCNGLYFLLARVNSISRDLMTQEFYFGEEEFAFPGPEFKVSVSRPLEDCSQGNDVLLWVSGKEQQIVHVEEAGGPE